MLKISNKNIIIITILILILALGYYNQKAEQEEIAETATSFSLEVKDEVENKSLDNKNNDKIVIHLSGAVQNPGVYELKSNQRLVDLIKAAGGLKEEADLQKINLAEKVFDGQKVTIPDTNEYKNIENFGVTSILESDKKIINTYSNTNNKKLININQADQKSLESLSGIGPAKAKAIIKYRKENSYFNKLEDLLKISGIGEKTLENIKNEITLK